MQKVVHIVTQMEAGGAQGAAVRLHQRMLNEGISSTLLFLYKKRSVYGDVPHCTSLLDHSPTGIWHFMLILWRLYQHLRRQPDTSIMCYTHYANVIGAFVGRLARVRRVVISHRSQLDCYPKLVKRLDRLLGTYGCYDAMICVSAAVRREFVHYPPRYQARLRTIFNGIDRPEVTTSGQFDWVANPAFLNLVTAGRLHEQKNHQVLFDAVRGNPKLRFIIAGEGHLRPAYENYIHQHQLSERLILLGEIPPQFVTEFISKGDIFVFPSQTEAFGFSLIEAMSIGLPVITSDIDSMKEISQGNLLQLSAAEPAAWTDALTADFEPDRLLGMSKHSKNTSAVYNFDNMYAGYCEVIFHG